MKIIHAFALSSALLTQLSASVLPSVVDRFKAENYTARQAARVELRSAFAESTTSQFDSPARSALESELLQYVVSDTIPLDGRLFMLRMLEVYGTDASAPTLGQLAQSADPIVSEAAQRAIRSIEGKPSITESEAAVSESALGRLIAYQDLLANDPARAIEVTGQILEDPEAIGRTRILAAAAYSDIEEIRADVLPVMLNGSEAEKLIAVAAINEKGLSSYEATVLALLPQSAGQLHIEVIACLGVIGSDDSFAVLYQRYEADPNNKTVQAALARMGAPSADIQAMRNAAKSDEVQARVAAVKLLALRNPEGATELLNGLLLEAGDLDAEVRKATYKSLEQIGNAQSVSLMLNPKLMLGAFQKDTQRSLKRLSLSLGIPDYLWSEAYQPSLLANDTADYRAAILAILDGLACEGSVGYLQTILEDPTSSDYALAYRSLQRWPNEKNLYASGMWLLIYNADSATDADREKAEGAIQKLLQNRHPDFYPPQINLLLEVGASTDLPVALKQSLFNVYAGPEEHFPSWYNPQAKRLLQPAVEMPDVAAIAQAIINKL